MKGGLELLELFGVEIALALSALLAVGAIAMRATRSPVRRHRLGEWSLIITVLATPLLFVPLPRLRTTIARPTEPVVTTSEPVAEAIPVSSTTEFLWPEFVISEPETSRAIDVPKYSTAPLPSEQAYAPEQVPERRNLARWLSLGFVLGAAGFALHLLFSMLLLARLARRAAPAPDWVRRILPDYGGARLLVSPDVTRPFCYGIQRGTILLPKSLVQRSLKRRLRAVLLHECAHLREHHGRARLLAALAAPLFYWQPLFWWLVRSMRQDAELVADDLAAASMNKGDYATELLGLVEATHRTRLVGAPGLGALGSRENFLERMETLLMRTQPLTIREPRLQSIARTTVALTLCATVTLAVGRTPQDTDKSLPEAVPGEGSGGAPTLTVPVVSGSFAKVDLPEVAEPLPLLSQIPILSSHFEKQADPSLFPTAPGEAHQTSDVDVEFHFGRRADLLEFQRRIQAEGGEFQLQEIKPLQGADHPVQGRGRLIGLTYQQRTPISKFWAEDWQPGSTRERELRDQIRTIEDEMRSLESRLSDLRKARQILQGTLAQRAAKIDSTNTSPTLNEASEIVIYHSGPTTEAEPLPVLGFLFEDDGGQLPSAQAPAIYGTVQHIVETPSGPLVSINRGKDHNVAIGTTFEIYSGSTYKGRIVVSEVTDRHCFGRVQRATQKPFMVGDKAASEL